MKLVLALTIGLPTLVQGYLIGALTLMFGFTHMPGFDGPLLVTDWRPWLEKRWDYCTTIAAWQGRPRWFTERTDFHEDIHLRQFIDLNALGAVLGACLTPWIGWQGALILWGTSGAPWLLPNFLTALIRHKRQGVGWLEAVYRGSEHEKSAYAQTAQHRVQ